MKLSDQIQHYENKLAYEIDSWDLKVALDAGELLVIVDARSPEAFSNGHIPGAVNIPHRNMDAEATNRIDRESLVVTYCDGIGCNASTKAALRMARLGFKVKELIGGLDWWIRDGYPVDGNCGENGSGQCGCG
ncbi:MAG: rhodanese-like domain-containing protein [Planctomycetota bacterium]